MKQAFAILTILAILILVPSANATCLKVYPTKAKVDSHNAYSLDTSGEVALDYATKLRVVSNLYRDGVLEYHDDVTASILGDFNVLLSEQLPLSWKGTKFKAVLTLIVPKCGRVTRTFNLTTPLHPKP